MPFLKKMNEGTGEIIELRAGEMVIGRAPECDLVLNNQGVSRKHVVLRWNGERATVCDLNSRNKTKLNEIELPPDRDQALKNGDRINICDVEFVYSVRMPATNESPTPRSKEEMLVLDSGDGATVHSIDASRSDLQSCAIRPEAKLKAILEISRNLFSDLDIDSVAPKVLDTLFELFEKAERGFLVLHEAETNKLLRKAFKHRQLRRSSGFAMGSYQDEVPVTLSRSIVNSVLDQKKAFISQDAGSDRNLPTSASIADLKIRSVMCAPLLTPDGKALGILQLDTSDRNQFNQDDLELLAAVANQAAISIQNARLHQGLLARDRIDRDLNQANRIQKIFLPRGVPAIAGYQFYAHYNPAYEVGGDYYDFVPLPGGRMAVAVADVSGKGVTAALMMAKFSGDTRYCILTEDAPAPAADALNTLLCDAGIEEKFITLSLGILDPARHRLTLCSAGHPPVLIRHADGKIDAIGESCHDSINALPLGIMPDTPYSQIEIPLAPGDVVVVYSDGVTDARNLQNDLYVSTTRNRLAEKLAEAVGGAEDVGKAIIQDIREFSTGQKQADDITLVCFGMVSAGQPLATAMHRTADVAI